jgi:hexokinase
MSDGVGDCPVEQLTAAMKRAGHDCQIVALLNDTIGAFGAAR